MPTKPTPKRDTYVYIMRTCPADMRAHGGFLWPTKGKVEARQEAVAISAKKPEDR